MNDTGPITKDTEYTEQKRTQPKRQNIIDFKDPDDEIRKIDLYRVGTKELINIFRDIKVNIAYCRELPAKEDTEKRQKQALSILGLQYSLVEVEIEARLYEQKLLKN